MIDSSKCFVMKKKNIFQHRFWNQSGLEVMILEYILKLKIKHNKLVRKQPIIALYFEFENEPKFYNLGAGTKCLNISNVNVKVIELFRGILLLNLRSISFIGNKILYYTALLLCYEEDGLVTYIKGLF